MKPLGFALPADENIHPEVVRSLVAGGKDVRTAQDEGLVGAQDVAVIRRAHQLGRVILTHDRDFAVRGAGLAQRSRVLAGYGSGAENQARAIGLLRNDGSTVSAARVSPAPRQ